MKTLKEFIHIFEGQIDGLKDVKIIRHYTTGDALKKILETGIIEPHESVGDEDWEIYDLGEKKVVSFHDARMDPEEDQFKKNNDKKISMDGYTPTLGLHAKKVCCYIDIDYDALDELTKTNTHLLNVWRKDGEMFGNLWNSLVDREKELDIKKYTKIKEEIIRMMLDGELPMYKQEFMKMSFQYCKDGDFEKYDFLKQLYDKVLLKYWSEEELNKEVKGNSYELNKIKFKTNLIRREIFNHWDFWPEEATKENLEKTLKKIKKTNELFTRRDFSKLYDDEIQLLGEYAYNFNAIGIVNIMRKHGWRFEDADNINLSLEHNPNNNNTSKRIGDILQALSKNKSRLVKGLVEIRVPSEIKLNKENCKIVIFAGIAEATKQSFLVDLSKKYNDKYNIEIIEPK